MRSLVVCLLLALSVAVQCQDGEEGETSFYRYVKIGFWWLLGVTIGVYFQARLNLR